MGATLTTAVFVFAAVFVMDVCWTKYICTVADKQPHRAAFWSTLVIVLSGAAAVEYVKEPLLLIPAGAGAWLATWMAVTRERNRELRRLDSE